MRESLKRSKNEFKMEKEKKSLREIVHEQNIELVKYKRTCDISTDEEWQARNISNNNYIF